PVHGQAELLGIARHVRNVRVDDRRGHFDSYFVRPREDYGTIGAGKPVRSPVFARQMIEHIYFSLSRETRDFLVAIDAAHELFDGFGWRSLQVRWYRDLPHATRHQCPG